MKKYLLLALLFALFCTACGRRSTGEAYYCMEGMQLLRMEADGTAEEIEDFSNYKSAKMLDWNSEGALIYAQYVQKRDDRAWGSVKWKLLFCSAPQITIEIITGDTDLFRDGGGTVLTQSYLLTCYKGEYEKQYLKIYSIKECRERYQRSEIRPLKTITGKNNTCTELCTKDGRTVILKFDDDTQLRLDPETMCLLSVEEPIPELLPEPEQKSQEEVDGYTIDGCWLVKDDEKVLNLSTFEEARYEMGSSGTIWWYEDDFRKASIEGIADGALLVRIISRSSSRRDFAEQEFMLALSLQNLEEPLAKFQLNSAQPRLFLLDGKVIRLEWISETERVWGYMDDSEDAEYANFERILDRYYTLNVLNLQTDDGTKAKTRDIFGVEVTGVVISYENKLVFACEDGSIRSYCPKTEEVSILLEPDESRGSIWNFGLKGSTLCWYELFQQGGQMHTLELE